MVRALNQAEIERALLNVGAPSSDYDLNPGLGSLEGTSVKQAGVLVPLILRPTGLHVILTKRSLTISQHAGQIAFPGGRVDPEDDGHVAAALREAHEEIGLPPETVEILGELPAHLTVTNYMMRPVVGFVSADFKRQLEVREVSEVFEVPLNHVADKTKFKLQSREWGGSSRQFYTVPYGPYYIWGATARVLYSLARRLGTEELYETV